MCFIVTFCMLCPGRFILVESVNPRDLRNFFTKIPLEFRKVSASIYCFFSSRNLLRANKWYQVSCGNIFSDNDKECKMQKYFCNWKASSWKQQNNSFERTKVLNNMTDYHSTTGWSSELCWLSFCWISTACFKIWVWKLTQIILWSYPTTWLKNETLTQLQSQ